MNGFRAIEWCLNHKLYQQGITLMREVIVSYVCQLENRNHEQRDDRVLIEKAFGFAKAGRFNFKDKLTEEQKADIERIARTPIVRRLMPIYSTISFEYRNDINHGGYVANAKEASEFVIIVTRKYDELKNIIAF